MRLTHLVLLPQLLGYLLEADDAVAHLAAVVGEDLHVLRRVRERRGPILVTIYPGVSPIVLRCLLFNLVSESNLLSYSSLG